MAYGGNAAAARRIEDSAWPEFRPAPPVARAPPALRLLARPPALERPSAFPEIDCIRHMLSPQLIAAAERRAAALGIGVDRVLIAANAIDEERYLQAFAARLDVAYEPLDDIARECCPLDDQRLIDAVAAGLLPLRIAGEIVWVIAPRHIAARRLACLIAPRPHLAHRIRVTAPQRLRDFAERHAVAALGDRAADSLQDAWPTLSGAPRTRRARPTALPIAIVLFLVAIVLAPAATAIANNVMLSIVFLSWIGLRLLSAAIRPGPETVHVRLTDNQAPVYTVICALYREASSVADLVASLEALDYAPEKLQVILVLERDDDATRTALDGLALPPRFEIVEAPPAGPRTKPKALNAALPFARGTFTVVYDAEDRPDPDQLRRALDVFRAGDKRLGCVQARLTIDNMADNWLTRVYTAEYAGQFDVFLPGLATLQLPLPLGGSSNHFRTDVLRAVGAWDPYNVTEDADLGMRLARFGYRTSVASSTTFEEAPAQFRPWLQQRTRWLKGWLQTWLVHMREPRRLLRELGPAGALAFQLVVGGNVLAPLVHPIFVAGIVYAWLTDAVLFGTDGPFATALAWLYAVTLAAGYLGSVVLGVLGLRQRRLVSTAWVLLLTPMHWLLLSIAAWRALFQLLLDPYRWEKTEHGLARTSLRGRRSFRRPHQ